MQAPWKKPKLKSTEFVGDCLQAGSFTVLELKVDSHQGVTWPSRPTQIHDDGLARRGASVLLDEMPEDYGFFSEFELKGQLRLEPALGDIDILPPHLRAFPVRHPHKPDRLAGVGHVEFQDRFAGLVGGASNQQGSLRCRN